LAILKLGRKTFNPYSKTKWLWNAKTNLIGAMAEKGFRERELAIKEDELQLRRKEEAASGWRNPLVVV